MGSFWTPRGGLALASFMVWAPLGFDFACCYSLFVGSWPFLVIFARIDRPWYLRFGTLSLEGAGPPEQDHTILPVGGTPVRLSIV